MKKGISNYSENRCICTGSTGTCSGEVVVTNFIAKSSERQLIISDISYGRSARLSGLLEAVQYEKLIQTA